MIEIPEKLQFLLEPHRFKVCLSGRGCGKSWTIARVLLLIGINPSILGRTHDSMFIMCLRETMKSISESVHRGLKQQIEMMGIEREYRVQDNGIFGVNNHTEFHFDGLKHNVKNIKSLESCDIAWVEEAVDVSADSWDTLIPTLRKKGSEIWVSFNPELDTDETYRRFVVNPPDRAKVVELTSDDNPWFTEENRLESEEMKRKDYQKWLWIYGGQTKSAIEGAVFKEEMARCDAEGRIREVFHDRTKPVQTFWDLGYDDMTSIWFVQPEADHYRIIDYMENSGKTIEWYIRALRAKEYIYGRTHLPWDALKSYKKLGTGRSIDELMRAAGFDVRLVKMIPVLDGINIARTIFPQCIFNDKKCKDGIQSLRRYQWGPMQPGRKVKEPLHDHSSHASDAFRYMAIAIKPPKPTVKPQGGLLTPPYGNGALTQYGGYNPFG